MYASGTLPSAQDTRIVKDTDMRWMSWRLPLITALLASLPLAGLAADPGLVTVQSKYSAEQTIQRFEAATKANSSQGWIVFTEINHAAAAAQDGLRLLTRTVIVFGNPRFGTPAMQETPTLAIDLPLKALVWQDDQGKVWLTYNSGEYVQNSVSPRHGLAPNPAAGKAFDEFIKRVAEQATE